MKKQDPLVEAWELWERSRRYQLFTRYIEKLLFGASTLNVAKEAVQWSQQSGTQDYRQLAVLVAIFLFWLPVGWVKAHATATLERLDKDGSTNRTFPK